MESPYLKSLLLKEHLKNTPTECNPSLGISLRITRNGGSSASGMKIGIGEYARNPIFIKIFSMNCPYKKIKNNGKIVRNKYDPQLDKDAMEIGFTRLLSDILYQEKPFTQNIPAFYFMRQCNNAYKTDNSCCSLNPINTSEFIVSGDRYDLPHNGLMINYLQELNDDIINYMGVEMCSGDLEQYFKSMFIKINSGKLDIEDFERITDSIFMQLIVTIKCLNNIFKPFYHSDLGPRNVLYTLLNMEEYRNTYFRYQIDDKIYSIENIGLIPKIWDFSNIYVDDSQREILRNSGYFDYLRSFDDIRTVTNEIIYNIPQLCKGIILIDEFSYVSDTPFGEKMRFIGEYGADDFDHFIGIFNNYIEKIDSTLITPVFSYSMR